MEPMSLFTAALGLAEPWQVTDVRFDAERGRIDFDVAYSKGSRFTCPACGAETQPVHDNRTRSWRHLNFFQYEAHMHAQGGSVLVQRVKMEASLPPDSGQSASPLV